MNVRNCKRCRKLFNYIAGQPICPACKEELEKLFQEVKKYIQDHRNCSVAEVATECDVEESQIRQWVREERLEFGEGSIGLVCETCGSPITTGRFCDKCKASMVNQLSAAGRRPEAPKPVEKASRDTSNRMRFLNQ